MDCGSFVILPKCIGCYPGALFFRTRTYRGSRELQLFRTRTWFWQEITVLFFPFLGSYIRVQCLVKSLIAVVWSLWSFLSCSTYINIQNSYISYQP